MTPYSDDNEELRRALQRARESNANLVAVLFMAFFILLALAGAALGRAA